MFAIEYSPKQNSFHVQPLEEAIAKNFNSFFYNNGAINDYVILHLTDDQEDAFRICSLLMDKRDSWNKEALSV